MKEDDRPVYTTRGLRELFAMLGKDTLAAILNDTESWLSCTLTDSGRWVVAMARCEARRLLEDRDEPG